VYCVWLTLVGIARDRGDALNTEIEWLRLESGLLQERYQERAQTSVHMEGHSLPQRNLAESSNVVDDPVREVWGRANNQDGVVVYETADSLEVHL
jgi:hypothetical protein